MSEEFMVNLLAGGVSGGVARFFVAPLDVIKIRFQVQVNPNIKAASQALKPAYHYASMLNAVSSIYKLEGVKGLWRGNLLAEIMWVAFASCQFTSYAIFKNLSGHIFGPEYTTTASLCSGAAAGAVSTLLIYPLDLLRTRFAAQSVPVIHPTIRHAVTTVYQTTGIRGFYYGVCPSLWQIVPYAGIQFFTYDLLSKIIGKRTNLGDWAHPICGGVAGLSAKLMTFPMDVAKKRLQVHGLHLFKQGLSPTQCPSLTSTLRQMYYVEGPQVFYKGITPSLIKSSAQAALLFACYEQAKKATRVVLGY